MRNPFVPGLGMFLRDYFASSAMQGFIAANPDIGNKEAPHVTFCAYYFADAMLAARYGHQPPAALNGFQEGDTVELIAGPTNGIHVASVVGFNISDPSRPKINVQAHDAKGKLVGRPYDTDPALWKLFVTPVSEFRTSTGDGVQLVNTLSQSPCCYVVRDGKAIGFVHRDGHVTETDDDIEVEGLVPNEWPLPQNALANVKDYIAARDAAAIDGMEPGEGVTDGGRDARDAAARRALHPEPVADGFAFLDKASGLSVVHATPSESSPGIDAAVDRQIGDAQAAGLVHAVANSTGDDSKP